ncbi:MAG: sporulation integral membrane protein YtvI [Clostridiales bacterium]|nr:sporulation integral membrane protein YtvI [Clostridiales bacterium]MCF8022172.1 sporulation integral membrane protein YtvI [Clostridiales bacterium]
MHRHIERLSLILIGALTVLALYAAANFVVPQVFTWFKYLLLVLMPFIIAILISLFMEPIIKNIQELTRVSRAVAVLFSMLVFFGGIGFLITILIIHLAAELTDLSIVLPAYVDSLQLYLEDIIVKGQGFYLNLPESVTSQLEQVFNLEKVLNTLGGTLQHWARSLANSLLTLISSLPGALIIIMISLVSSYFISKDKERLINLWVKIAPEPWGERTVNVSQQSARAFMSFIKAQLILVFITSVLSILGLSLIGNSYAITMGLIIGFFDLVPVLGPGAVYVPWAAGAFIMGSPGYGFKLLGLYLIVVVIRAMLEAKVVASNLGLHPLAVLLAMYAGLKTIGVVGLIVGPIVVITLQAAIKTRSNIYKIH